MSKKNLRHKTFSRAVSEEPGVSSYKGDTATSSPSDQEPLWVKDAQSFLKLAAMATDKRETLPHFMHLISKYRSI